MFKILREIKDVFIPPKKHYYVGKLAYGCPYMYPRKFNSTIIDIRKVKRTYERNFYFYLFGYCIAIGWPIWITWHSLGWKDKFDSPRHEWDPSFYIYFFKWQFIIKWVDPIPDGHGRYWEMVCWYLYYCNKDIEKAKKDWDWISIPTRESTWSDKYLKR